MYHLYNYSERRSLVSLDCKLYKKTFTTKEGELREYYVLQFPLVNNETLEIPIKSDKAKLLSMSHALEKNN